MYKIFTKFPSPQLSIALYVINANMCKEITINLQVFTFLLQGFLEPIRFQITNVV